MKVKFLWLLIFLFTISINLNAKEIIVKKSEIAKLSGYSYKILRKSNFGYFLIDISENEFKKVKNFLKYRIPKKFLKKSSLPDDPLLSQQWAITNMKLENLWDINTDCSNVLIAVIDTGVDYNHEDLKENIYKNPNEICNNGIDDDNNGFVDDCYGWNFAYNNNNPMDDDSESHGTHVTGIIAATGDNGKGVAGVCWKASIIPIKALDYNGEGTYSDVADAIDYAVKMGAKIINLSVEAPYDYIFEQAIKEAYENNVLVVCAAGNAGYNLSIDKSYPASFRENYSNVINVGSYNSSNLYSDFSNYGALTLDLAAPGDSIISTLAGNHYGNISGSSMATGFVTGLVAQIMGYENIFNPDLLRAKIINSAKGNLFNTATVSGGIIDSEKIFSSVTTPVLFKTDKLSFEKNEKLKISGYNLYKSYFYDENSRKLKTIKTSNNEAIIFTPPYTERIKAVNDNGSSNYLYLSVGANTYVYIYKNWNLVSIPVSSDFNVSSIFSNAETIWNWVDNNWKVYSNNSEINQVIENYGVESFSLMVHGKGYWIKSNDNFTENFQGNNYGLIWNVSKGWNLLGAGTIVNVEDIFNNYSGELTIWKWDGIDQNWKISTNNENLKNFLKNYNIENFNFLYPSEGFWLRKE